ncbi:lysozyme [Salmonella enterica subsp. enterica]|uniref:Lysozyme n=2 Tax=Salmonella enterica TaxID=28901 RepID=A0A447N5D3_SALET|nr:lysozyme [Salmonella enterica subsp. enterica]
MNPSIVKRCLVGAVLAIVATLPGFQSLHTSVEGLKLIADYEGCRLQPYQCSAGVWTDGIGNTSGVVPGKTITERQAAQGLITNVLRVERALDKCVVQPMPQKVYDAVVSFAFNVGTGNACSSTLVKLLNQRRWADACLQLPRWVYVKGVFNQGWITAVRGRWPGALKELDYDACAGSSGGAGIRCAGLAVVAA